MAGIVAKRRFMYQSHLQEVELPAPRTLRWTGEEQTAEWSKDVSHITVTGNTGTNVGTYTATMTPVTGYVWADTKDRSGRTVAWEIKRAFLNPLSPAYDALEFHWTGDTFGPSLLYDDDLIVLSGDTSASSGGDYEIIATPDANHCWGDGTFAPITTPWHILSERLSVPAPSVTGSYAWSGSAIQPALNLSASDMDHVTLSGDTSKSAAGAYSITVTPNDGYVWSDGSGGAKSASWSIARARFAADEPRFNTPSSANQTYAGVSINAAAYVRNHAYMTYRGNSARDVGNYTMYLTPDANHAWSNGTTGERPLAWSIVRAKLASSGPQWLTTSYTFDGNTHSPTLMNSDAANIITGGSPSTWKTGIYTATATPDANHAWADGSATTVSTTWTISAARLTGSGTFHMSFTHACSIQLVGGGGGGASGFVNINCDTAPYNGGGAVSGGGRGEPGQSVSNLISLSAGDYAYSCGEGGIGGSGSSYTETADKAVRRSVNGTAGTAGGQTTFGNYSANGGAGGQPGTASEAGTGGTFDSFSGATADKSIEAIGGVSPGNGGKGGNAYFRFNPLGTFGQYTVSAVAYAGDDGASGYILISDAD